ncbi:DUF222 domain-containing protein, partial [Mycobacterium sp. GA-2829]|uniref:DUF222 domain-containing protein n=1 Tax=Mycobacterium sp. GA-2829 TaxID=1772283 RepID=UPI0012F92A4C
MVSSAPSFIPSTPREAQLEALFDEMSELAGQRNAIDARLVEIAAEIDGDRLWGATGARSVTALVAWKVGCSTTNAKAITAIADRIEEFPLCVQALREGRLSLDQVGVIADKAGPGSDEHYAELAKCASVNQLRTAIRQEPKPKPTPEPAPEVDEDEPEPELEPACAITQTSDDQYTFWRIQLTHAESAKFEAAL